MITVFYIKLVGFTATTPPEFVGSTGNVSTSNEDLRMLKLFLSANEARKFIADARGQFPMHRLVLVQSEVEERVVGGSLPH